MRRLAAALLAAGLLLLSTTPVAAVSTGTVRGRVLNRNTGRPAGGAAVTLLGGKRDGTDRTDETVTVGPDGRFRFDDLPTGDDRLYVLDVTYRGGTYAGDTITLPDDTKTRPVVETTVRVFDTTTDPNVILLRRDDLFVDPAEGGVEVIESLLIANTSNLAYIGRRGGAEDETAPTLGLPLPAGAVDEGVTVVDSSLNVPSLVRTDFGVGVLVAIPPGETRITYIYTVPGSGGIHDLSRTALYGTLEMNFHADPDFDVRSNRLAPNGDVTIEGASYERYSAMEGLDPGDAIQIVAEARGGFSAGLMAGIAVLVVAVLLALAIAVRRLGRRRAAPKARPPVGPPSRRELVVAIAELDLRHRAGEIGDSEYELQRADLKERLEELEPEPAP